MGEGLQRAFAAARATRESKGLKVHGTGLVTRSDGNDTDCGAYAADPDKLLTTDDPQKITCKRCLAVRRS